MRFGAGAPAEDPALTSNLLDWTKSQGATAPAAQLDTSTWVVIAADGSTIPYGLASAQVLATNPTVRTPQGDYAYSELSTLYGFASAPGASDGVPFIPGFLQTPTAVGGLPGWALAAAGVGVVLLAGYLLSGSSSMLHGYRRRRRHRR